MLAALLLLTASAGQTRPAVAKAGGYLSVLIGPDGRVDRRTLASALAGARREGGAVIVLIHGFNTNLEESRRDFGDIAPRLRSQARAVGVPVTVIGVHWAADAGSEGKWLSKAAASRVTSLLGFRKAVRNPYKDKCEAACQTGRIGMRRLLFQLRDGLPGRPVHVFTHSLGSQVLLSALAPEPGSPVASTGRTLKVDTAVLAGADLDHNIFEKGPAAAALDRVRLWWVTVPEEKTTADGVLELRRGAGRPDAVGNKGLTMTPSQQQRLLKRGGLKVDRAGVPTDHAFIDYYPDSRLRAVLSGLRRF